MMLPHKLVVSPRRPTGNVQVSLALSIIPHLPFIEPSRFGVNFVSLVANPAQYLTGETRTSPHYSYPRLQKCFDESLVRDESKRFRLDERTEK